MKKWSVLITVDATVSVEVDANTEEEAKTLAMGQVECPTLCYHCSRDLELGDVIDAVEAIEID